MAKTSSVFVFTEGDIDVRRKVFQYAVTSKYFGRGVTSVNLTRKDSVTVVYNNARVTRAQLNQLRN